MVWPTVSVDTSNLDADSDNPRLARPSLKDIADFINLVAVGPAAARTLLEVPSVTEMDAAIAAGVDEAKAYSDEKVYPMRRQVVTKGGISLGFFGVNVDWSGGIVYADGHDDFYEEQNGSVNIVDQINLGEVKRFYVYKDRGSASLGITDVPPVYFSSINAERTSSASYLPNKMYRSLISCKFGFNFESMSTSPSAGNPGEEVFGHYNDVFNTGLYDMRIEGTGAVGDTSIFKFGTRSMKITASATALVGLPYTQLFTRGSWTMEGWFNFSLIPGSGTQKVLMSICNVAGGFDNFKMVLDNTGGTVRLKAYLSSNGTSYDIINAGTGSSGGFVTGQWYHIAFRYNADNNTYMILFNGNRDYMAAGVTAKIASSFGAVRWGNDRTLGANGFLGNMDSVSLIPAPRYNVDLSYSVPTGPISDAGMDMFSYANDTAGIGWSNSLQRAYVGELLSGQGGGSPVAIYSYLPGARSEIYLDTFTVSTNYTFKHRLGFPPMSVNIMGQAGVGTGFGQINQHVAFGSSDCLTGILRIHTTPQIWSPDSGGVSTPTTIWCIIDRGW